MARSSRLFEIIQLLRQATKPLTAAQLAQQLEVTMRTVYRDIAALQAMRVPIEGAAGIGYVMRAGYDLPPLMFDADEVEAIMVGLSLLRRTGDRPLIAAADSIAGKIAAVLPVAQGRELSRGRLVVSGWNKIAPPQVDMRRLRGAIREAAKLRIAYAGTGAVEPSLRVIRPLAILYYIDSIVLAGWCELRAGFRHFRVDRILSVEATGERFDKEAPSLLDEWRRTQNLP